MKGTIRFVYDAAHDVHVSYPVWTVETEEDCKAWFKQYEDYCARLGGPVDMVFVLDGFRLGPRIGGVWGRYRAEMVSRFTRHSVRIHADTRVLTFTATSAALYAMQTGAAEAKDLAGAFALIEEKRRASR